MGSKPLGAFSSASRFESPAEEDPDHDSTIRKSGEDSE